MKLKFFLIAVLTLSLLVSCKSKKILAKKAENSRKKMVIKSTNDADSKKNAIKTNSTIRNSTVDYIEQFKDAAMRDMHNYNIPASIKLAQGILESSSGNSQLTKRSNNHFGIKCHSRSCEKGHCSNFSDDSHKDFFRKYKPGLLIEQDA